VALRSGRRVGTTNVPLTANGYVPAIGLALEIYFVRVRIKVTSYLNGEISSVGVRRSWKAGDRGILKANLDIKYTTLPFHSVNRNTIWTQLRRKTRIQIECVASETITGKTMCENLQESTVTGQKAERRVDTTVCCVDINGLLRELIEWKAELNLVRIVDRACVTYGALPARR
jgi:hypothetical protein